MLPQACNPFCTRPYPIAVDVLIEAGGTLNRLDEKFAVIVAEHLRAHADPRARDECIAAADKLERALVGESSDPVTFEPGEAVWVRRALDGPLTGHPNDPDLLALSSALAGPSA
jgi:hypothetical protein